MTNYAYTRNIPASQNNPSNDQSPMRTNTNSTDSIIGEDHYSFGVANGGLHKRVRIIDLAAIPAGLAAGMGTVYTKLATSIAPSTESSLFYSPGSTGREYRLTRTIDASFAQFATKLTYGAPPDAGRLGGWTFLPGGLLMQYGTVAHSSATDTIIPFPVAFTTVYSVTTGGQTNNSADESRADIGIRSLSTTGFTAHTTSSTQLTVINWMAIGI